MLYTFKCKKVTCGLKFDQPLHLAIYEKYSTTTPPFYDLRCPACWTKSPARHYDAQSIASFPRDHGTWDPRTAPPELAGQHYADKQEKEKMVAATMGANIKVAEPDRDMTAKPTNGAATRTFAKDATVPTGPLNKTAIILTEGIRRGTASVSDLQAATDSSYATIYNTLLRRGVPKVSPGVFDFSEITLDAASA